MQLLMLELDSLPPHGQETVNGIAERSVARDFLEYAVIFSIQSNDKESFQRYLSSLRPYYTSHRWDEDPKYFLHKLKMFAHKNSSGLAESEQMYTILGLNLLYLLVENKLVEFHSEVCHAQCHTIDMFVLILFMRPSSNFSLKLSRAIHTSPSALN